MDRVLVTGGAGVLGSEVVRGLLEVGYVARVMSRRERPAGAPPEVEWAWADLATGAGVEEAVAGARMIVHAASATDAASATAASDHTDILGTLFPPDTVDVGGTRLLLAAAQAAGVAHVVYVSIVGVDRVPLPYYRHKLAAEAVVRAGGVPWSILRVTQFHPFVDVLLRGALRWPLAPLDTALQIQPVDERDAAARLVAAVRAGPAGALPDFGGPEVRTLGGLTHDWLAARGLRRRIVPARFPGKIAAAVRAGGLTCPTTEPRGTRTWEEWLASHNENPYTRPRAPRLDAPVAAPARP